ncbi:MAG: hypothetical protein HWQ58_33210 [Nostoc sp. LPT]|nr:hypothetical protein [Nostoc sp. LPT]
MINRLTANLQKAFPEMKGFPVRNLKHVQVMCGGFAEAYTDEKFVQRDAKKRRKYLITSPSLCVFHKQLLPNSISIFVKSCLPNYI